jgi:hypothetical protein
MVDTQTLFDKVRECYRNEGYSIETVNPEIGVYHIPTMQTGWGLSFSDMEIFCKTKEYHFVKELSTSSTGMGACYKGIAKELWIQ